MKFQLKTYTMESNYVKNAKENLSIGHISDLHAAYFGPGQKDLLEQILKLNLDFLCATGDMFTGVRGEDVSATIDFFCEITKHVPVYYENGNHEQRVKRKISPFHDQYVAYRKALEKAGVVFLENSHVDLQVKGVPITIYGLELPLHTYDRFKGVIVTKDDIEARLGKCNPNTYTILLAHHPRFAKSYFAWGADLTLSGHIHGGICRLFGYPIISPDGRIFPKFGYGQYEHGSQNLIVSAGIGEHTIPFRICNPRELVQIKIQQEEPHGDTR